MKKNTIVILIVILVVVVLSGGIYQYTSKNKSNFILEHGQEETTSQNNNEEKEVKSYALKAELTLDEKMPDFTLMNLQGEQVSLSDYEGKIVLINFWATWCGYCDAEMPDLQKLGQENEDIVVLAVNVEENKAQVEKYIDEGGYDFEVLLDEDGKLSRQFLIAGLPSSYFVNKEGIFVQESIGWIKYDQMEEIVEAIREYY